MTVDVEVAWFAVMFGFVAPTNAARPKIDDDR